MTRDQVSVVGANIIASVFSVSPEIMPREANQDRRPSKKVWRKK